MDKVSGSHQESTGPGVQTPASTAGSTPFKAAAHSRARQAVLRGIEPGPDVHDRASSHALYLGPHPLRWRTCPPWCLTSAAIQSARNEPTVLAPKVAAAHLDTASASASGAVVAQIQAVQTLATRITSRGPQVPQREGGQGCGSSECGTRKLPGSGLLRPT